MELLIEDVVHEGDAVVFTDGSVQRGVKSAWAFAVRVDGVFVEVRDGAMSLTTSSLVMEVKAITEALIWLRTADFRRVTVVTDSMCTLQKVQQGLLHADWVDAIRAVAFARSLGSSA